MLTLANFIEKLREGTFLHQDVIFLLGEDHLEIDTITTVPKITIKFIGADSFTFKVTHLENDNAELEKEYKTIKLKVETLLESARDEKWEAARILRELEGV